MIIGDTHGNTKQIRYFFELAAERKITHVLSVGDFGLWTHSADGHSYLDSLNQMAEASHLSIYAIGGNHENWDHWNWYCQNMPTHKGFAIIRSRVLIAPKVHSWRWANKQFFGAGGAVSIDRDYRLAVERGGTHKDVSGRYLNFGSGTGSRTQWWPNEQLTDQDVNKIKDHGVVKENAVDYLFTHDCSNLTTFKNQLKIDSESMIHRQRIDRVLGIVKPKIHMHGHMHNKYEWVNTLGTGFFGSAPETSIQTYGLEADYSAMYTSLTDMHKLDNWGILDTETDTFSFKGESNNSV